MFLVTGVAGFIGFHVARRLLNMGQLVVGIDNINASYDPSVKYSRFHKLQGKFGFTFIEGSITSPQTWVKMHQDNLRPTCVIHLAAQAGVRESLDDPHQCVQDNIVGFTHVLEFCTHHQVKHLVYASTSAVYGAGNEMPWKTSADVTFPVSLYAATKKANELIAHVYSTAHGLYTTGLRFFTVYGPYGRPDMAIFKFTRALFRGEEISLFNNGDMSRDFTYVDDIVNGILAAAQCIPENRLYRIYNLGSGKVTKLTELVTLLEELTGKKAKIKLEPMQVGDLQHSLADIGPTTRDLGFVPQVDIKEGLANFVQRYREFRAEPGNEKY